MTSEFVKKKNNTCVGQQLQKCFHVLLFALYILQILCIHQTEIVQTSHKHHTEIIQTSYKHLTEIMYTSYRNYTDIQTSYRNDTILKIQYKLCHWSVWYKEYVCVFTSCFVLQPVIFLLVKCVTEYDKQHYRQIVIDKEQKYRSPGLLL